MSEEQIDKPAENLEAEETLGGVETETEDQEPQEVEIVLNDESQAQPDKLQFINARLQKSRDKLSDKNEAQNEELEGLRRENEALKQPAKIPSRYDFDTEDEFQQALTGYIDRKVETGKAAAKPKVQGDSKALQTIMTDHYARAEDLKVANYNDCEEKVIDLLGDNGTRGAIVAAGKDSARLIAFWGNNPKHLQQFINRMQNEQHFNAQSEVGRLCGKLQANPKRSGAPPPDTELSGAGVTTSGNWAVKLKAVYELPAGQQVDAYRALNAKAIAEGVNLREHDTD